MYLVSLLPKVTIVFGYNKLHKSQLQIIRIGIIEGLVAMRFEILIGEISSRYLDIQESGGYHSSFPLKLKWRRCHWI